MKRFFTKLLNFLISLILIFLLFYGISLYSENNKLLNNETLKGSVIEGEHSNVTSEVVIIKLGVSKEK